MLSVSRIFSILLLISSLSSYGNNIAVSNVSLTGRNTSAGVNNAANYTMVKFDLSWSNSWRYNSTSGSISYIGVKSSGTGYTGTPSVTIAEGGGTATATVSGEKLIGITITNAGSGYTSVPSVYIGSQGSVDWVASTAFKKGQMLRTATTPVRYYIVTQNTTTGSSVPTHTGSSIVNNLKFVSVTDGNGSGATADAHIASWWDAAWVFVKFRVGASDPEFTSGVSSSGNVVTVSSTSNLRIGMPVKRISGSGTIDTTAVITAINSPTTFTISGSAPNLILGSSKIKCTRIWEHAILNDVDHIAPSGSTIDPGLLTPGASFDVVNNPALGVFMYRSSQGGGNNSFQNVNLRWNYAAQGLFDDNNVEIKVFAIEMVYVPEGSFYVGSGGNETGSFTDGSWTSGNTVPLKIASENSLNIGQAAGSLWGTFASSSSDGIGGTGTLSASYPKGYSAFYCMKYEISQGQYVDFLNTLTRRQQIRRVGRNIRFTISTGGETSSSLVYVMSNNSTMQSRNAIMCDMIISDSDPILFYNNYFSIGVESPYNQDNDGQSIACNYLSWMDGCSYLDWSGLRPITELEFEKASRGVQEPLANERAWGSNEIISAGSATAVKVGSRITSVTIDHKGSGYTTIPQVTFSGGSCSISPTATVTLNANREISAITITNPTSNLCSGIPSVNIESPTLSLIDEGKLSESTASFSVSSGNANWGTVNIGGPLRVGVFSGNSENKNRSTSGATYYGIMEMNGNLAEQVVSVGRTEGRSFTGMHGDGNVNAAGNANVDNWPGLQYNSSTGFTEVSNYPGSGLRGGAWNTTYQNVSNRTNAILRTGDRNSTIGFRGGRTAL